MLVLKLALGTIVWHLGRVCALPGALSDRVAAGMRGSTCVLLRNSRFLTGSKMKEHQEKNEILFLSVLFIRSLAKYLPSMYNVPMPDLLLGTRAKTEKCRQSS